jgi:hypothetical protein
MLCFNGGMMRCYYMPFRDDSEEKSLGIHYNIEVGWCTL